MMVRELGFEMKARPSEKMKTPEELAKEEKEKLQKLEVTAAIALAVITAFIFAPFYATGSICFMFLQADRLRRMMGDEDGASVQSQVHMSADDLNDGFVLDKNDKKTLAYQVSQFKAKGWALKDFLKMIFK